MDMMVIAQSQIVVEILLEQSRYLRNVMLVSTGHVTSRNQTFINMSVDDNVHPCGVIV